MGVLDPRMPGAKLPGVERPGATASSRMHVHDHWRRWWCALGAALLVGGAPTFLPAQGVTTAVISGTVRDATGAAIDGATVRVANLATGMVLTTRTLGGAWFLAGLEPGVAHTLDVTALGFAPKHADGIVLGIGERRGIAVLLARVASRLQPVAVLVTGGAAATGAPGAGAMISDSSLRRLPAPNRSLYDFVGLTPQVGTRFGLSGAGRTSG